MSSAKARRSTWSSRNRVRPEGGPAAGGCLALGLLALALVHAGCAAFAPAAQPPGPVFSAELDDLERYDVLARRQERLLEHCGATGSCAYLHFSRGLVGLFEDRRIARRHFSQVVALVPDSRLASSSRLWIELIDERDRPSTWNRLLDSLRVYPDGAGATGRSTEQLVRDLLEREIVIQRLLYKSKRDEAVLEALQAKLTERGKELERLAMEREELEEKFGNSSTPSVRQLKEQIAVQDKKIKELHNQLDALKRIDQEMRRKVRPLRPAPLPEAPAP